MKGLERPCVILCLSPCRFLECFAINDTFTKIWKETVMASGGNVLQPASRARSAGKSQLKRAEEEKEGRQEGGRVTEQWVEVHNTF